MSNPADQVDDKRSAKIVEEVVQKRVDQAKTIARFLIGECTAEIEKELIKRFSLNFD